MTARPAVDEALARVERIRDAVKALEAKAERSFRQGYIIGALVTTALGAALTYWWPL